MTTKLTMIGTHIYLFSYIEKRENVVRKEHIKLSYDSQIEMEV